MSIVSIEVEDMSNYLCKRFATLAASYFDHPAEARSSAAQVPLENLFRVLEMFRNETFFDETRKGVLALDNPVALTVRAPQESDWHKQIERALNGAFAIAFGQEYPPKVAAGEIQGALRRLATDQQFTAADPVTTRAKTFFNQLSVAL